MSPGSRPKRRGIAEEAPDKVVDGCGRSDKVVPEARSYADRVLARHQRAGLKVSWIGPPRKGEAVCEPAVLI